MLIAVPLSDRDFDKNLAFCKEKGADVIELRVDLFENPNPEAVLVAIQKVQRGSMKTILTVRSEREGGRRVENRLEIFKACAPHSDYTDVELSSTDLLSVVRDTVKASGKKLIISYHNFEATPPAWVIREIFREARSKGADLVKVSVKANSYQDVAKLLCASSEDTGEKVLIAMGDYGKVSRVVGFAFRSVISYAYVGDAVAPGQLSLEELVKIRSLLF